MGSPRNFSILIVVVALAVVGCGGAASTTTSAGDSSTTTTAAASSVTTATAAATTATEPDSGFPVTVETGGAAVTIESRPERMVSLSATATEMLFAIGAGEQVVAVDSFSYYPPEAPVTDLSGFEPNVEAIVGFEPDLVVLSFDPGDVVAGLEAAGVPTLVLGAAVTLDDTYTQIEQLGAATGRIGDAAALVGQMQTDIDDLAASVPARDEPLTYYHELDDTLFSVTSETFIGEIYALAGLENIADAADPEGEAGGYPQLSAEFLVSADPDLIFLADTKCCGQNAETLAQRPGSDQLTAVAQGRVIELDDDIASRWGPRIVEFFRKIVEATAAIEVPAG
ncbi:MAG TPA: ABC transporter substrate-binding protein [Acidimicrobiia bacterium]|nr:ABC transporter substrate-binding protein [Acidimicrobiia bacterium]